MDFNPYLSGTGGDPYRQYHELRRSDPVHRSSIGVWFISRYADAEAVLQDRQLGRNFDVFLDEQMGEGPLRQLYRSMLLYMDPPAHTRLRSLVSGAFSARVVDAMRERIRSIASDLLGRAGDGTTLDVINDFGFHLPVLVICQLLGVPPRDRDLFREWSQTLSATLELVLAPSVVVAGDRAAHASTEYLRALIADRRSRPGDDLLSRLIFASEGGERLTEAEIVGTCMFLFGAGHQTTMGLIGNAVHALLRHPAQLERLRADPSLVPAAIDETLRYDSPVQVAGRVVREAVEIDGRSLAAGEVVAVLLGAANRDPARFADPDAFDLERPVRTGISFGGGLHYCLGARLGRVEAEIALAELLRRFPSFELASKRSRWQEGVVLRSLEALPIRVSGGSR